MFGDFTSEIFSIVMGELKSHWKMGLVALLISSGLFLMEWLTARGGSPRRDRIPSFLRWGLLSCVAAAGVYHAWQFAWLGDDAFISFRYSKNLAEGYGLVFNHGEWVEGFTNFLWTFSLGVLNIAGASIPHTALVLNLAAFVGVVFTVHAIVHRYAVIHSGLPSWSAVALACCAPFVIYATSGLETMPGVLCVVLGIRASLARSYVWGALFFVFGGMMRPDHILFWGTMGLALAIEDVWSRPGALFQRLDWKRYLKFTLPLVFVFVPYFAYRAWLYGDLFPNTYYAKSGGLTYFSQGARYLGVFLGATGGIVWLPLWVTSLFYGSSERPMRTLRVFSLLSVLIFGTYVAKVGGDFMENRFLLVLLPIVFVTTELGLRSFSNFGKARKLLLGLGVLTLATVCTRVEVVKPFQKKWHIAAEHTWYQITSLEPLTIRSRYFAIGKKLGKMFEKSEYKPRIAYPCVGMVGYYSELPLVDTYGLVNRRIARKELKKRGRPGHEKRASLDEVLAEGAVLSHDVYAPKSFKPLLEVKMAGTSLYLLEDASTLKEKLRGVRGIRWPKNAVRAFKQAKDRQDRTGLVALSRLGDRILDEETAQKLEETLNSVDEFEDGYADWSLTGDKPNAHAGFMTGMSGRTSLRLHAKGRRVMTRLVTLKAGEGIGGMLAGGGTTENQGVGLYANGKPVDVVHTSGAPYFEPFRLFPKTPGEYELRVFDEESKHDMWIDGVHRIDTELELSSATLAVTPAKRYRAWLSDLQDARANAPSMVANQTLHFGERWGFDAKTLPTGFIKKGKAFGSGPVFRRLPKQRRIEGPVVGRFLSSFHGGDKTTGRIESPKFELTGSAMHVLVAGGNQCKKVYLGLLVDGKLRRRICGRNDETFRPETISLKRWQGKEAQLVVVDESKGSWGHIMVDEIVVSTAAPAPSVSP